MGEGVAKSRQVDFGQFWMPDAVETFVPNLVLVWHPQAYQDLCHTSSIHAAHLNATRLQDTHD